MCIISLRAIFFWHNLLKITIFFLNIKVAKYLKFTTIYNSKNILSIFHFLFFKFLKVTLLLRIRKISRQDISLFPKIKFHQVHRLYFRFPITKIKNKLTFFSNSSHIEFYSITLSTIFFIIFIIFTCIKFEFLYFFVTSTRLPKKLSCSLRKTIEFLFSF